MTDGYFRSIVTTACNPSSRNVRVASRPAKLLSNLPSGWSWAGAEAWRGARAVPCMLHVIARPRAMLKTAVCQPAVGCVKRFRADTPRWRPPYPFDGRFAQATSTAGVSARKRSTHATRRRIESAISELPTHWPCRSPGDTPGGPGEAATA